MKLTTFRETAEGIGSHLCAEAIWTDNLCYWIGNSLSYEDSQWKVVRRPIGPNLYSGTSGIALFLARLFRLVPDPVFRTTAEAAVRYSIAFLDQLNSAANFGFYSGLTGLAYVLHEMAESFSEQEFTDHSMAILRDLPRVPIDPLRWDIVSGSAGVVPVLLKLYSRHGDQFLLDLAVRHGEALVQSADQGQHGWSWAGQDTRIPHNLTGFSHGTSGVAWALLELYCKTGAENFQAAAHEALRYERYWFSAERQNWPDFRGIAETGEPYYVCGWCHGAPGIGLSRLRAFQLSRESEYRNEAEIAARTTSRSLKRALASHDNYCLCHGHFGNAELLLSAVEVLEDQSGIQLVHEIALDAMQKYSAGKNPWPCGVANAGETPDLMLGLAGIGYFFLRLHDPEKTPSVLLVGPA